MLRITNAQIADLTPQAENPQLETPQKCSVVFWDSNAPNNEVPSPNMANTKLNGFEGPICSSCESQLGKTCPECSERWDEEAMEEVRDQGQVYKLCPNCAEGLRIGIREDRDPVRPGLGQREEDLRYNYVPLSA